MLSRPPPFRGRGFQPGFVPLALAAAVLIVGVSYVVVMVWLLHMVRSPEVAPSPPTRAPVRKPTCASMALSSERRIATLRSSKETNLGARP